MSQHKSGLERLLEEARSLAYGPRGPKIERASSAVNLPNLIVIDQQAESQLQEQFEESQSEQTPVEVFQWEQSSSGWFSLKS